jgi:DNA-binding NtrC family response regulator
METTAPVTPDAARRPRVLIIDDEEALLRTLGGLLTRAGFDVQTFSDALEGLTAAKEPDFDVALVDINLPNISGMELLRELKTRKHPIEVIIITGEGSIPTALEAVRLGAYDYLTKPFIDIELVISSVRRATDRKRLIARNRELEQLVKVAQPNQDFIGQSAKMRDVFQLIEQVSYSSSTVLIQGESGTGKELVARSIHRRSQRASGPFVAINCAAMTETLLESELFGHVRGAFTGAAGSKKGLIEAANGGTLFLDEIGDMPLVTQVKLLRVLQEGEVRPVGSTDTQKVDVRVIAATNVDIAKAMVAGKFREDLFYRLNVITVSLPALRERPTDVPLLAQHFLKHYGKKLNKRLDRISDDALEALVSNSWPGNVRELENVIERATVLARGTEVTLSDLPPGFAERRGGAEDDLSSLLHMTYAQAKRLTLTAFDRRYLHGVMRKAEGNITAAANMAGLDRSNFRRLLKQHSLAPNRSAGMSEEYEGGAEA